MSYEKRLKNGYFLRLVTIYHNYAFSKQKDYETYGYDTFIRHDLNQGKYLLYIREGRNMQVRL